MSQGDLFMLALLAGILAFSAASDAHRLRIPNTHVLAALVAFALVAPFMVSAPELLERLMGAGIAFCIGFVLFSLRLFGGGDVKMMAAVMLYIPSSSLAVFLFLFSLSLLVSTLAIAILQRLKPAGLRNWASVQTQGHVPVGVSFFLSITSLVVVGLP